MSMSCPVPINISIIQPLCLKAQGTSEKGVKYKNQKFRISAASQFILDLTGKLCPRNLSNIAL